MGLGGAPLDRFESSCRRPHAIERAELVNSARISFRRLAAILQIPLANKKAVPPWCGDCSGDHIDQGLPICTKCQRCHRCKHACGHLPAYGVTSAPALGPTLALPCVGDQVKGVIARLSLTPDKQAKYEERLSAPLLEDCLRAGPASKLVGTVEWTESAVTGRQLRAFLWPIRDQIRAKIVAPLSPAVRAALQCMRQVLREYPVCTVMHSALKRRYCLGFTDARGRAATDSMYERIAGVLITEQGVWFFSISAGTGNASEWLPPDRSARINEAESLAALTFLASFKESLQGVDLLLLLDSSAAEGTLIMSYSSNPWLTCIAGAFWQLAGGLDLAVWIAYVPSGANLADAPSRKDYRDAQRRCWVRVEAVVPSRHRWSSLFSACRRESHLKVERKHIRQMRKQGR